MSRPVSIKLKLECGFINDKVPIFFNKKPIYICLLTERSDGHLIDFRRIRYANLSHLEPLLTFDSAKKLNNGQDVLLTAAMTSHTQYIICYVMCEEIGRNLLI